MNALASALMTFKFGNRHVSVTDLIGESELARLKRKFPDVTAEDLVTSVRELSRYLYLVSIADSSLFFPGDRLMDDVWHALITETVTYREYCDKIQKNNFFDHTGIKFSDYVQRQGSSESKLEMLSWLTSYLNAFGELDENAYAVLALARELAVKLDVDRNGLNAFARQLLEVAKSVDLPDIGLSTIGDFCRLRLDQIAAELDGDSLLVGSEIKKILSVKAKSSTDGCAVLTIYELEQLFGSSVCLGFSIWQHLAALERLAGLPDWQANNATLWSELKQGRLTCGLATTHLGRKGGSPLLGVETDTGFSLSGAAPWVSGNGYFDKLIIGFESDSEILFFLIDYPNQNSSPKSIKINPVLLSSMNGTATCSMEFKNFELPIGCLVSRRLKGSAIIPRATSYVMPELGIAKKCLSMVRSKLKSMPSPIISDAVTTLDSRLERLELARKESSAATNLSFLMTELIRDSLRILSLAEGGSALRAESFVSRTQLNILLLDAVFQAAATLEFKIQKTANSV